ncbi:MAG: efflux RND transporter periplasmic adaptor subunit [Desulfotomaculaceae bacterium]|nr:efflux RND transporter periplasmic adaptor subunit [Desulfotomaculaceae bacterium]
MKRKRKIYLWGGLTLIVMVIAALLLMQRGQEVATVQVQAGSINRTVADSGYIQPASDFNIHATQTARVTQVLAETGQPVKQGETLVVLENLDLSLQISEVQSQKAQAGNTAAGARAAVERLNLELKDASDNLNRVQQLFNGGAVSLADYDKAVLLVETCRQNLNEQNSQLDSARAQEAGLRQTLGQLSAKEGQLVVKSPTDGMVLNLPVKQEAVVSPGALLAVLAVTGQLEVKADILSDDLGEMQVGQKVSITAPVLGQKKLEGEVKKIYPRAEEKQSALGVIQRRVPVIITLPEAGVLKPGYEVRVAIETLSRKDVLVLPREAVRTMGDGHKEVMVVVQGQMQRRSVQTGLSDQENIEVTSGLESGEVVITDGGLDLKEKAKVKPIEKV